MTTSRYHMALSLSLVLLGLVGCDQPAVPDPGRPPQPQTEHDRVIQDEREKHPGLMEVYTPPRESARQPLHP